MKMKEIIIWGKYIKAIKNGEYMEKEDYQELIRLNHLVMEEAHKIHNDNMLSNRK